MKMNVETFNLLEYAKIYSIIIQKTRDRANVRFQMESQVNTSWLKDGETYTTSGPLNTKAIKNMESFKYRIIRPHANN